MALKASQEKAIVDVIDVCVSEQLDSFKRQEKTVMEFSKNLSMSSSCPGLSTKQLTQSVMDVRSVPIS